MYGAGEFVYKFVDFGCVSFDAMLFKTVLYEGAVAVFSE